LALGAAPDLLPPLGARNRRDGANGEDSRGVMANRRLDGRIPPTGRRFHDNGGRRANNMWAAPRRRTIGVSRLRAVAGETRAHVVVLGMQGGIGVRDVQRVQSA